MTKNGSEPTVAQTKRELDHAIAALADPGAGAIANLECRVSDLQVRLISTPARDLADVEDVKSDDTTTADGLRLDVGAKGDAFVVWVQNAPSEGDRNDVYASRFSGGAWSIEPKRIDVYDGGDKSTPDMAVDGTGAAYAVWLQNEEFDAGDRIDNVWLTEYAPGSDWANPVLIEPPSEDPNDDGDDYCDPGIAAPIPGDCTHLGDNCPAVANNTVCPCKTA